MNIRISKTKYLNGLQCKKLLWYIYHEPEAIPEPDEATRLYLTRGIWSEITQKSYFQWV